MKIPLNMNQGNKPIKNNPILAIISPITEPEELFICPISLDNLFSWYVLLYVKPKMIKKHQLNKL